MEIIKVNSAGFCFGVKRAVKLAIEASEKYNGDKIYTIGPIIHNNDVVNFLKDKGITPILDEKEIERVKDSVVILRSHGVKKEILDIIINNNNKIVDAICPFVKKIHEYVAELTEKDYFVVIIGDKDHPEVKAIKSYAESEKSIVITNALEAKKVKKRKIGVVVQTTQDQENFLKIVSELVKNKGEIRIFNSICNATSIRQKESIEVAKKVDLMVVIGGKHSANTKRLFELCKSVNNKTYHIENSSELEISWFKNSGKIGVTAGASTPENVINDVLEKIKLFTS